MKYLLIALLSVSIIACSSESNEPTAAELGAELKQHESKHVERLEAAEKQLDNAHRYSALGDAAEATKAENKYIKMNAETAEWDSLWQIEFSKK